METMNVCSGSYQTLSEETQQQQRTPERSVEVLVLESGELLPRSLAFSQKVSQFGKLPLSEWSRLYSVTSVSTNTKQIQMQLFTQARSYKQSEIRQIDSSPFRFLNQLQKQAGKNLPQNNNPSITMQYLLGSQETRLLRSVAYSNSLLEFMGLEEQTFVHGVVALRKFPQPMKYSKYCDFWTFQSRDVTLVTYEGYQYNAEYELCAQVVMNKKDERHLNVRIEFHIENQFTQLLKLERIQQNSTQFQLAELERYQTFQKQEYEKLLEKYKPAVIEQTECTLPVCGYKVI